MNRQLDALGFWQPLHVTDDRKSPKPGDEDINTNTEQIAERFSGRGPWKKRLPALLETLVTLGRAREQDGRYRAAR